MLLPGASRNDDDDLGTHVRFMVPPGMRVDDVKYEPDGEFDDHDMEESASVRWNGEVVSIYVQPSPSQPNFDMRIYMNPRREIFTIPAFVACLVSYIVGRLVLHWVAEVLSQEGDVSCSVKTDLLKVSSSQTPKPKNKEIKIASTIRDGI